MDINGDTPQAIIQRIFIHPVFIMNVVVIFFCIYIMYRRKNKNQGNKDKSSEKIQSDCMATIRIRLIDYYKIFGGGNPELDVRYPQEFTLYSFIVRAIYGDESGIKAIYNEKIINEISSKIDTDSDYRNKICSELYGVSIGMIMSILSEKLNRQVDLLKIQEYLKTFENFNQKALCRGYILSFKANKMLFVENRIEALRYYQDIFSDLFLNKKNNHQDYPDQIQSRLIEASCYLSFSSLISSYEKDDLSLNDVLISMYGKYEKSGIFK